MVVRAGDVEEGYQSQGTEVPDAVNEAGVTIHGLIDQYEAGAITAKKLSEGADKIIEDNVQNPILRVTVPQLVSHATVNALLENEDAEGASSYIAHHTKSMVDNHSPHADVVSQAIGILEGHWSDEEAATVASKAVDNAEYFLARNKAHMASKTEGDKPTRDVSVSQFDDNRAQSKAEISFGVQELEQYLAE